MLAAFRRALAREMLVLRRDPGLLWQQLHNRLRWEEEPVYAVLAPEFERRNVPGAGQPFHRRPTRVWMSAFPHRSCRRPARTIGLYAIAVLPLFAGWCYRRTTADPSEVRRSLAEYFSVSVPPPRDHTVFFFGEAHVYTIPTAESAEDVESDLYSRLHHYGYLPAAGERTGEAAVELMVGERHVEALRVEETSSLGRMVRYRVPIGDERVMVALGPAERFDEDAMTAILTSVRKRGEPLSELDKILLVGLPIAMALIALRRLGLVRSFRARTHGR